jgi:hypothetical protein
MRICARLTSSLLTPNLLLNLSLLTPMTSPVVKLAMAGASGARSPILRPLKKCWAPPMGPFFMALGMPMSFWRTLRLNLMGTSLKVSTPPAMMMSAWPAMIFSAAVQMAMLEEMQAWVMVWDGTLRGMPAPMVASRAMLDVLVSWMTVPMVT